MKNRIRIFILMGALVSGMAGCGLLPQEEEMPTAPILAEAETEEYKVATVARSDVQAVEEIRANYVVSESEKYSFKMGMEEISEVYVEIGDIVEAGGGKWNNRLGISGRCCVAAICRTDTVDSQFDSISRNAFGKSRKGNDRSADHSRYRWNDY